MGCQTDERSCTLTVFHNVQYIVLRLLVGIPVTRVYHLDQPTGIPKLAIAHIMPYGLIS